jgi:hypothetical protein
MMNQWQSSGVTIQEMITTEPGDLQGLVTHGLHGRSLKIEAANSSETLVLVYESTRCVAFQVQCRDSLTTHKYLSFTQIQTRCRSTAIGMNMRALEMCSWNTQGRDIMTWCKNGEYRLNWLPSYQAP